MSENMKDLISERSRPDENGCWIWTGCKCSGGYGHINRKRGGKWRMLSAHRLAYQAFVGEIPEGRMVCHRCDVRSCVNPGHLFLGTALDNVQDAIAKGRLKTHGLLTGGCLGRKGESNPNRRLKLVEVEQIRIRSAEGESQRVLATAFQVSRSTIRKIVALKMWK